MKDLKTEYKLLIVISIVFIFVLSLTLVKQNVLSKKIDEIKSKKYITCTKEEKNKGVNYTENFCSISDDTNTTYIISFPTINIDSKDVKTINNKLSSEFNKLKNKIDHIKAGDKFYIDQINSMEYKLYNYNDILSILIKRKVVNEKTLVSEYKYNNYNINIKTGKVLNDSEMKNLLKITLDLSSDIRMKVIEMYAQDFQYDYIGKLSYLRNRVIDSEVEKITYSNMTNLFIDDFGNVHFYYDLYNPDLKKQEKYLFTIKKDKKITLTKEEER